MTTAYQAAHTGAAILDRSHWGCISVTGADRIRFLHNQTTNDFQRLQPGQGCSTVFVTSTARTLDWVTAYVRSDDVLLLTSPEMAGTLVDWMDRYIFFADKVTLKDVTDQTFIFYLVGPAAADKLASLVATPLPETPYDQAPVTVSGVELTLAANSGLALPGYTLIGPQSEAQIVWQSLTQTGILPLSAEEWERLRVEQGRPLPSKELTDADNPLEAGLWSAISFDKGCYIGQETIARLNTYKGVKKRLWGLELSQMAEPGTVLTLNGEKVGEVRSTVARPDGTAVGLGYVRTKAGGEGLVLQAGSAQVTTRDIPLLSHDYFESAG
ncbi:MAG: folate-binding protein [Cyanobacteria bacterium J06648_16]